MLRDEEILELLGDGNISQIGSPRSETENIDFPFAEFEPRFKIYIYNIYIIYISIS